MELPRHAKKHATKYDAEFPRVTIRGGGRGSRGWNLGHGHGILRQLERNQKVSEHIEACPGLRIGYFVKKDSYLPIRGLRAAYEVNLPGMVPPSHSQTAPLDQKMN